MLREEGVGSLVGKPRRRVAPALAHLGGEAVVLAGIVVEGDAWMAVEGLVHRLLLFGRHEMIGPGDVEEEWLGDRVLLVEDVRQAYRIIADARVDAGSHRRHVSEAPAEAVADHPYPAAIAQPAAGGADRRLDVLHPLVLVETPHQVERALELRFDVGIQLNSRLEFPEKVWRYCEIALPGEPVALAADAFVDPEYLLDHDDRAPGRLLRLREVGIEVAVAVEGFDPHRRHGLLLVSGRASIQIGGDRNA